VIESASTTRSLIPIPKKATGKHFYKYSPLDNEDRWQWLRELLIDHRLYVPTLTQMRDPSDGRPKLAPHSEDQLFTFLYNDKSCGVLARNRNLTPEEQIKEAVYVDRSIDALGKDWMLRELTKRLHEPLETWRAYSLCKRHDNLSMWENYADNHSGYCLEFANKGPFFESAYEVSYGNTVEMDLNNPDHRAAFWFYCKKKDYSNEEEIRVLMSRHSDGTMTIQPAWLKRIILGWKMLPSDRDKIRALVLERLPQLNIVEAFYDEFDQTLKLRS
jgi:hypothetical protein